MRVGLRKVLGTGGVNVLSVLHNPHPTTNAPNPCLDAQAPARRNSAEKNVCQVLGSLRLEIFYYQAEILYY